MNITVKLHDPGMKPLQFDVADSAALDAALKRYNRTFCHARVYHDGELVQWFERDVGNPCWYAWCRDGAHLDLATASEAPSGLEG